jgi:hypothetical protein
MSAETRAYGKIRDMVERRGGTMVYRREGYRYGAWEIIVNDRKVVVESMGIRRFPELDRFYKLLPEIPVPKTYDDYDWDLVDDAEAQLDALLSRGT